MSGVNTLVYFDIEATGLKSSGRPRITEISLLAVNTHEIFELHEKIRHQESIQIEKILPRVMNKLTLCVYPMATIMPHVTSITGLDNYNLIGQSKFERNTGELISGFLDRLPAPVCLVAHNGNAYDFPLLKAEMEKAGVNIGSDICCADSYIGIKEIVKKKEEKARKEKAFYRKLQWLEKRKSEKIETATTENNLPATSPSPINLIAGPDVPTSFSLYNLHVHLLLSMESLFNLSKYIRSDKALEATAPKRIYVG